MSVIFETQEVTVSAGPERVVVGDLPAEPVPARRLHGVAVGPGQRDGGRLPEPGGPPRFVVVAGQEAAGADGRRGHQALAAQP